MGYSTTWLNVSKGLQRAYFRGISDHTPAEVTTNLSTHSEPLWSHSPISGGYGSRRTMSSIQTGVADFNSPLEIPAGGRVELPAAPLLVSVSLIINRQCAQFLPWLIICREQNRDSDCAAARPGGFGPRAPTISLLEPLRSTGPCRRPQLGRRSGPHLKSPCSCRRPVRHLL